MADILPDKNKIIISETSRRIAKNTIFLYLRMLLLLVVSLYTSRLVLNILGETDFGVYSVVNGLVAFMVIFTGAIQNAVNRFLAVELGKNGDFQKVFSSSLTIMGTVVLCMAVFIQPFCSFYMNKFMDIPPERLSSAAVVLHCSFISFYVYLLSIPYNCSIIAYERMEAFTYISFIEGIMSLSSVVILSFISADKLIVYAVFMLAVKVLIRILYGFYCKKYCEGTVFKFELDFPLLKRFFGFSGWLILGNAVSVINTQGINQLINYFFGVTLNTAVALASKVESSVMTFVSNFLTAINPQIAKSCANEDYEYMNDLIFKGAKYSYLIILFLSLPLLFETDTILKIWLGDNIPKYTSSFVKLALLISLCRSLGHTVSHGVNATGDLKRYQIYTLAIYCVIFPLSAIFYVEGFSPVLSYVISLAAEFILIFVRILISSKQLHTDFTMFYGKVLKPVIVVSAVSLVVPSIIVSAFCQSVFRFFLTGFSVLLVTPAAVYLFAMTRGERFFVNKKMEFFAEKIKNVRNKN